MKAATLRCLTSCYILLFTTLLRFPSLFGGGKRRSYKWSVIGREGLTICRWGEEEGGEGLLFFGG